MDGILYSPGAGTSPPLLAGRDALVRDWRMNLRRAEENGRRGTKSFLLTGPRGVGKTCTVSAFAAEARSRGFEVIDLQATGHQQTLVSSLVLRADACIAANRGPWSRAKSALERFSGVQLGVGGISAGVSLDPTTPTRTAHDPESLAAALAELAHQARRESKTTRGGLMVTVDEMQVGHRDELTLLSAAFQRLNINHSDAPVVFAGTGLTNTMAYLTEAGVTHPDRLFVETRIPLRLSETDARLAVLEPAEAVGVAWESAAVDAVLEASNCYPAHLQYFAEAVWVAAQGSIIERATARAAIVKATEELTMRSVEPRWEGLSGREAELLTAIALHGGRATSEQLRNALGRNQADWSVPRAKLIESGDVYSPRRGVLEATVPALAWYALQEYPSTQREHPHLTPMGTMSQRALERTPLAELPAGARAALQATSHGATDRQPLEDGTDHA